MSVGSFIKREWLGVECIVSTPDVEYSITEGVVRIVCLRGSLEEGAAYDGRVFVGKCGEKRGDGTCGDRGGEGRSIAICRRSIIRVNDDGV